VRFLVLAACISIAACSLISPKPDAVALRAGEVRSAQAAKDSLAIGKSTKTAVRAALGEATVIDFESGYEVWLYRERPAEKAAPAPGELVLLFDPSGRLIKTRLRR
jgi:hypothetical protein